MHGSRAGKGYLDTAPARQPALRSAAAALFLLAAGCGLPLADQTVPPPNRSDASPDVGAPAGPKAVPPSDRSDAPPDIGAPAEPKAADPTATVPALRPRLRERALALEWIGCRRDGEANIRLFVGEATDITDANTTIRLEHRFAAKYTPSAAGVDDTDWWCVPRKRFCFKEVAFSDWRGTRRVGEEFAAASRDVFHFDWGIERFMESVTAEHCRK